MTDEERKKLLVEIRIAYQGIKKILEGVQPTPREQQALDIVDPIDVTAVLLEEIKCLERQHTLLIYDYNVLKDQLK